MLNLSRLLWHANVTFWFSNAVIIYKRFGVNGVIRIALLYSCNFISVTFVFWICILMKKIYFSLKKISTQIIGLLTPNSKKTEKPNINIVETDRFLVLHVSCSVSWFRMMFHFFSRPVNSLFDLSRRPTLHRPNTGLRGQWAFMGGV